MSRIELVQCDGCGTKHGRTDLIDRVEDRVSFEEIFNDNPHVERAKFGWDVVGYTTDMEINDETLKPFGPLYTFNHYCAECAETEEY